jgi:hypothetical protein
VPDSKESPEEMLKLLVTNLVSKNLEMFMMELKRMTQKMYLKTLRLTFSGLDAAL